MVYCIDEWDHASVSTDRYHKYALIRITLGIRMFIPIQQSVQSCVLRIGLYDNVCHLSSVKSTTWRQ